MEGEAKAKFIKGESGETAKSDSHRKARRESELRAGELKQSQKLCCSPLQGSGAQRPC